jgi:DNA-binding transcriptional LysR family regulator
VRVGSPDGFGTMFLAPRLIRLRDAHPNLNVQLVTSPFGLNLTKREADLVIGLSPPKDERLYLTKLTDVEIGLYASQQYLKQHEPIKGRAGLRGHRFIGYVPDLSYAPGLDYLSLMSQDLELSFTCSNIVTQFQAAVAGGGLCVMPYFIARQDKSLQRVLPSAVSLTRSLWISGHSELRNLARVRVVFEFITEEVRTARASFVPKRS